jgi:hydroxymethylpyrimidine/phosphomethylpyrimidine kinase
VRVALTIAGTDPTGGAGLPLDLQVFRAHGVHGAAVVTAIVVQDTSRVHRVLPVFPSVVLDQIRVLARDFVPDAVKIGMLATDDVARSVALGLDELERQAGSLPPLVIDPVLAASDGSPLLERRAWPTLLALCGRARLVTPNLPEAAALSGSETGSAAGAEKAARFLVEDCGAAAVLLKGGHRDGPPDDLLAQRDASGTRLAWLPGRREAGAPAHGTGCALASALAARLARGEALEDAVAGARAFVLEALRRAEARGHGARLLVLG